MCRCGIDCRVQRPICRRCRGCDSCGCKCKELEKAKPLGVKCPGCGVEPGKPCLTGSGNERSIPHETRKAAAVREARRQLLAGAKA